MTIGTLTQKLRPIRFAFVVNPNDRGAVQQAIELASSQWGGALNPIVPAFNSRLPARWSRDNYKRPRPKEVIDGYLSAFDPDYVVLLGDWIARPAQFASFKILPPEELLAGIAENQPSQTGIDALAILHHFIEKEFAFQRKVPLRAITPQFSERGSLFLSSVFGAYPEVFQRPLQRFARTHFTFEAPHCTLENFFEYLGAAFIFPRRIGMTGIKWWIRKPTIYCLDATSPLDIIDYWNLRACGHTVIPLPSQSFAAAGASEYVKSFVQDMVDDHHDSDLSAVTFQVSRSLNEQVVKDFIDTLRIPSTNNPHRRAYAIRGWYPRLWDRWAQENTDQRPISHYAVDHDISIDENRTKIELRTLLPDFFDEDWWAGSSRPCVANELTFRTYGAVEPLAEVMPEADRDVTASMLRDYYHRDMRISSSGLVVLAHSYERRFSIKIPIAQDLMIAWLGSRGWKAELSPPGLIACQILKRLEGMSGMYMLGREGLLQLLDRHASEKADATDPAKRRAPRWVVESAFLDQLSRILKMEDRNANRDLVLQRLLDFQAIQLGLQLRCKTCFRQMWIPIGDLQESIECDQCATSISVATAPREERQWSYKPYGPFNVRGFAGGAYPVLMTLRFLSGRYGNRRTTPLFSFKATHGDSPPMEVDLALFCENNTAQKDRSELIFCECKAYDEIRSRDIERMGVLASAFPGSVLVFSKMAPRFMDTELPRLRRFAQKQRRLWEAGRPNCTVMLLTGVELFSDNCIPECWGGKGGIYESAAGRWHWPLGIIEQAEATQDLYLGIPGKHKILRERFLARPD